VAEEGAEVGAVGVVVGVEAKARDLLHSSRLAGASTRGCHNSTRLMLPSIVTFISGY